MKPTAVISPCTRYRYHLRREWARPLFVEGEVRVGALQCVAWKAAGGYAAAAGNTENSTKERIWFSPHCERAEDQADLFAHAGGAP